MYPRVFVDSHCHLNLNALADRASIIEEANRAGVFLLNTISTKRSEWKELHSVALANDCVFYTVGVHPLNVDDSDITTCSFEEYVSHHKMIGIGEIGLDFHLPNVNKVRQIEAFEYQLEVSTMRNLPVVIHQRDAHDEMLRTLQKFKGRVRGVIHCFTGTYDMAVSYIDLGFYISFSGIITFNGADIIRECASKIPMDKVLIETDSPYLAPVPYRGKTNFPRNVVEIAKKIAILRGVTIEEIGKITTDNFFALFDRNDMRNKFFREI
ncbi:Putative DNA-binding protein [Candidatus Fokinia solitaria]|uniref:DNA-binding protein n=1 Tax=Candidatus Fokinia solitaria TaxID=1802984 RepID=A0A2U8BSI1_9RICK|nr:TatD family hydrolase [Candidatus Fokinia solitaria]AWD33265.1 Putative DNA-binding protein [Candidatus Fokinia solitaria]